MKFIDENTLAIRYHDIAGNVPLEIAWALCHSMELRDAITESLWTHLSAPPNGSAEDAAKQAARVNAVE